MELVKRFWSTLTYVVSFLTFSPFADLPSDQVPLLGSTDIVSLNAPTIEDYSIYNASPTVFRDYPDGPIFKPPGDGEETGFKCDYSAMVGFKECSDKDNRGCWLRHFSGLEFNVKTDYEVFAPRGIQRNYTLDVVAGHLNADGLNFPEAKLFKPGDGFTKGQLFEKNYPGPWIEACWGDRIKITVNNYLPHNGTSIHWHGIRQKDSMHMDGVNGVTQCPIAPKSTFVYEFDALQYGSTWYHSHYSLQYADGLQGPMTIHGPHSAPWDHPVFPLLITDWGHTSAFLAIYPVNDTDRKEGGGLIDPSILFNGRGSVTRYNGTTKSTIDGTPVANIPEPWTVTFSNETIPKGTKEGRNKRYLLRLINTSYDHTYVFSIDHHMLTIMSSDFVPIHPYSNYSVLIGIGQRYHVVVEAKPLDYTVGRKTVAKPPEDGNFWIRTLEADCFLSGANDYTGYERVGIVRYNASSTSEPTSTPWSPKKISTECSDETYSSLRPIHKWEVGAPANGLIGQEYDVTPDFKNHRNDTDGPGFPMAGFSFEAPDSPGFRPLRIDYDNPTFLNMNEDLKMLPEKWVVIPANYSNATGDQWVYLALAGFKSSTNAHPIHLHGHDFAILQQEQNQKLTFANIKLKLDNPPRRDVVLLPTNGFVVIAFKADNPGAWLMHCHIAFHASFGLALQIMERQEAANKTWPKPNNPAIVQAEKTCAEWKDWQSNCVDNWWHDARWNQTEVKDYCAKMATEPHAGILHFQDDSGI